MGPFDAVSAKDLGQSIAGLVGVGGSYRCLCRRDNRAVYLVQESSGGLRVFKLYYSASTEFLRRFVSVHECLAALPRCVHLVAIVGYGVNEGEGLAWEELQPADNAGPLGRMKFEDYSPEILSPGEPSMSGRGYAEILELASTVLSALEYLHANGFIHGDVKPSNILKVDRSWKLGDYDNLVRTSDPPGQTGSTEGYRPPGGSTGAGSDTYAFGKSLYEMWTGYSRLEYPALPRTLLSDPGWGQSQAIFNQLINALCASSSVSRLTNLETIRAVVEALMRGRREDLKLARRILRPRVLRRTKLQAGGAVLGMTLLGVSMGLIRSGNPTASFAGKTQASLNGNLLHFFLWRSNDRLNSGFVSPTPEGILCFNLHATYAQTLVPGDHVEILLQKEAWRGHVGIYLTPTTDFRAHEVSYHDVYGGVDYLMFWHLEGDLLVAPTRTQNGAPSPLSRGSWNEQNVTNSLGVYRVTLDVGATNCVWSSSCDGLVRQSGSCGLNFGSMYLNFYVFDNTTCLLRRLDVTRPSPGR